MKPWILAFLLILPIYFPFLRSDFFIGHDSTHIIRLAELNKAVSDGQIPPRWSANLAFGYGMPLFSFYAPLPYYLGLFFHYLGFSYLWSIKLVFIATFILGFVGMYYACSHLWHSQWSGLIGALLFSYVPYRAVDVYVRSALGEIFAISLLPWCIFLITRYLTTRSISGLIFVILSLTFILLSHNLIILIGIPVLIGYSIILALNNRDLAFFRNIIIAFLWALSLSAYFTIPALLEKNYTSVNQLTLGEGTYSLHFVYIRQLIWSSFNYGGSIEGTYDGLSFAVGWWLLIGLVVLIVRQIQVKNWTSGYLIAVSLISLFMTSKYSSFIWKSIPIIQYLQFPWRFLSLTIFTLPLLVSQMKKTATFLTLIAIFFTFSYFKPQAYLNITEEKFNYDPEYIQTVGSAVIPDYIHPKLANQVLAKTKSLQPHSTLFSVNHGMAKLVDTKSNQTTISVDTDQLTNVAINIFNFPGWQMYVDGKQVKITEGSPLPILTATVAPGYHVITATLKETFLRKFSNSLSLIALFCLLIMKVVYGSRRHQKKINPRSH